MHIESLRCYVPDYGVLHHTGRLRTVHGTKAAPMNTTCAACGATVTAPVGVLLVTCSCGAQVRLGDTNYASLDPHAVLGVTPDATAEEIRAAYRQRARETHPDHGGDPDEFRAVQIAWELLRDDPAASHTRRRASVGMPDIVGVNIIVALRRLREHGLIPAVGIVAVPSNDPLVGTVVGCQPGPGATIPTPPVVKVTVAMSDIPGLRRRLLRAGRDAIGDIRRGVGDGIAHERHGVEAPTLSGAGQVGEATGRLVVRAARTTTDIVALVMHLLATVAVIALAVVVGVIRPVAGLVVIVAGLGIVAASWAASSRRRRQRRERGSLL